MLEYLLFGLFGLSAGSFGGMLIDRLRTEEGITPRQARGQVILTGRSRCPKCRKAIHWYDLVPILSYIVLRGRCRNCGKSISAVYPLTELLCAGAFVLALYLYAPVPVVALTSGIGLSFLVFAAVYDALYGEIPDLCTIVVGLSAIVVAIVTNEPVSSLVGALIPLVWFGLQWTLTRGRAVGTGDVFLAASLGLWLGARGAVTLLIVSYIVGALVILALLVLHKIGWKQKRIPFAPFLGISMLLTLLGIGDWYAKILHP